MGATVVVLSLLAGAFSDDSARLAADQRPVEDQLPRAPTVPTTTPEVTTTASAATTTSTAAVTTTTTALPITTSTTTTTVRPTTTVDDPAPRVPAAPANTTATQDLGGRTSDGCHPSYQGACLPPDAPDVDCAGGSGNGPAYATETDFVVVGPDVYDLDGDGHGYACES